MSRHPSQAAPAPGPATFRRLAACLLLSIALTATAGALTASSASAALPFEFAGTQSWNDPSESDFARLGNAEVPVFRAQLSWARVEPEAPTNCSSSACSAHDYRWDRYDQMFDRAARAGVRLVPVLLGSPPWASPDRRWVPTYGRNWKTSTGSGYKTWQRQAFYDFAKAAARRYGNDGTFWDGKSYAASAPRARHWQIWNEPNLPNYWWNRPSTGQYAQLLKGTSSALKAGDPAATTITAGLPWTSKAPIQPPEFLQKVFSVSGTSADFVAIHPYARTSDLVIEAVRQTRRALNSTTAKTRRIWLTEFGWADSGPSSTFTVSEATQARYLREAYRKLLRVRSTTWTKERPGYGVRGAIWFNLVNVRRPADSDAWYYHTGLFTSRGVAKDSWYALNCVTMGAADDCRYGR